MSIQNFHETAPAFDAKRYVWYLLGRWRFIAAACLIAGLLALGAGMLTPSRYTSTASILIEAPAGNDSRISTSVSPVYLESLKTYEVFATSDTLFLQAVKKFHLRASDTEQTIESLKSKVLKVSKLRDTKVMQISVTLKNPRDAQAMAQFLAEETVKLSLSISRDSGADLIEQADRQAELAKANLDEAQAALTKAVAAQSNESLKAELESMIDLQYRLKRRAAESDTDAVEFESRAKASGAAESTDERLDRAAYARRGAAMRARAELERKQAAELDSIIAAKSKLLAESVSRVQRLDAVRNSAQAANDAAVKRAQDLKAAIGFSGERLKLIDRGGVPERPSEPRVGLQVAGALGLALLASIVCLSLSFSFRS